MKFFIYHTVPKKSQKGFPETRKKILHWKHQKKLIAFEKKKSHNAKNPKKRLFGLIKRFFTNRQHQKNSRGYPLIEFKKFRKKSCIVPKKNPTLECIGKLNLLKAHFRAFNTSVFTTIPLTVQNWQITS